MVLIGFDPGLAHTGWGVIEDAGRRLLLKEYGVIETSPSDPTADRLMRIGDSVRFLLERFMPDTACMERLFFSKNRTSAIPVAEACGVILAEAARQRVSVGELTPVQIKQAVTGDGRAEKEAVQIMVRRLLNMKETPHPDHAADALAAAIAGSRFCVFREKVMNRV